MAWYGENRSGRLTPWPKGAIVRYASGPSALMVITDVVNKGQDHRGISCSIRYYGEHIYGGAIGRYHGQCEYAGPVDLDLWTYCNDAEDKWIPGRYTRPAKAQGSAIPENVLWHKGHGTFYSSKTDEDMGEAFRLRWTYRASDFPKFSLPPQPRPPAFDIGDLVTVTRHRHGYADDSIEAHVVARGERSGGGHYYAVSDETGTTYEINATRDLKHRG